MANVLVVDDEVGMLAWLAEILEVARFHVFTARNGRQAMESVKFDHIDLVITDISMPNEDGFELIRSLRREFPRTKIIAISGKGQECLEIATILGASAGLAKPVEASVLLRHVGVVLEI
jgi:YesN/AraC family two-component response regulator